MAEGAWKRKAAALLEVSAVLFGGTVVARGLISSLGISRSRDLLSVVPEGQAPPFLEMAGISAAELLLRYGILFGLAFALGWWHRRRRLRSYGVSLGGRSLGPLLWIGLLLFAAATLLPLALQVAAQYVDLGPGPAHWSVLDRVERDFGFWVFMAVSSFGLVPVVEELFVRGYFQTRLTEDLGPATAILLTALVFAVSHAQYWQANLIGPGMLLSLVVGSIFSGYVFYRTGSLLPVIVAHALGNVPYGDAGNRVVLALILVVIVAALRPLSAWARELLAEFRRFDLAWAGLGVLLFAGVLASFAIRPFSIGLWGGIALVGALLLEARDRSKRKASAAGGEARGW